MIQCRLKYTVYLISDILFSVSLVPSFSLTMVLIYKKLDEFVVNNPDNTPDEESKCQSNCLKLLDGITDLKK